MKKVQILLLLPFLLIVASCGSKYDGNSRYESFAPDGVEFKIAEKRWNVDMRGNHRALVSVKDNSAEAVVVNLPWRRPDLRMDTKKIVVTDTTGNEIKDVVVTLMSREKGQLLFKPSPGQNEYYVYYLPYRFRHGSNDARYGKPWNDYLAPDYEADTVWVSSVLQKKETLPSATVKYIESCTKFNFWSPMGLIATEKETAFIKEKSGKDMIIFPEDRAFPIQFKNYLPSRWNKVPQQFFRGYAMRNEYYCWQFGIWAAKKDIHNVKVHFSDFTNGSNIIPSSELTCFNLEGTDWDGKHVEFSVDVPNSCVQALWCGVQIPEDAATGTYNGSVTISAQDIEPQTIDVEIQVSSDVTPDKGDSEPWRHSRLRWLNSTIAMDNEPTEPYRELTLDDNKIDASGKTVIISPNGMVNKISTNGKDVIVEPQKFTLHTSKGIITFDAKNLNIHKDATGLVSWTASSQQNNIKFDLSASMEFDGHLHYDLAVSASDDTDVEDVQLTTYYSPYSSEYFMGCGFPGGYRPDKYSWDWKGPYDSYWIGGVMAGMHTEFRGGTYHGPLLNDYKPAPTPIWSNEGKGRVTIKGIRGSISTVTASTGSTTLSSVPRHYEFNLLITPVREIKTSKHFAEKYYHANPEGSDEAAANGATIFNIHHAQALNPYINYPFIIREPLINHIKKQHESARKVKLYYTIRELTTHCEEVYAFHSLNHEVFSSGVGYGLPWECEHLIDDYKPAWYTSLENLPDFEPDAALVLTGNSRFINYWLEGLKWMVENYDLDGIYMDDVSFDRTTVKRIRKILDRYHKGSLIDLHSNTGYSRGPANQYTEFFPYVDRLWFGESFRYNELSADEWLVTFSGIPFGRMSEMLQDGGNIYLGMIFGATARYTPVSRSVWKFWDQFGIGDAKMIGWWDSNCPVRTSDNEVKATAYIKDGKTLISIGNFSDKDKSVSLNIDWKSIGLDPSKVKIVAPDVKDFQSETKFDIGESICVKAKQGWLLVLSM